MEFALPELLSRDEILAILNQRQLHIQNINDLTHEELMRVYKTFVLPLSRRPERRKVIHTHDNHYPANDADCEEQMQVEHCHVTMDIDMTNLPSNNVTMETHDRMTSPLGEKRRQRESDDEYQPVEKDYQYQLSSATKRIKINSLF